MRKHTRAKLCLSDLCPGLERESQGLQPQIVPLRVTGIGGEGIWATGVQVFHSVGHKFEDKSLEICVSIGEAV